jgi:hypothetical protein
MAGTVIIKGPDGEPLEIPTTVQVKTAGGTLLEMDVPTLSHRRERFEEDLRKGDLVIVEGATWVEEPAGTDGKGNAYMTRRLVMPAPAAPAPAPQEPPAPAPQEPPAPAPQEPPAPAPQEPKSRGRAKES